MPHAIYVFLDAWVVRRNHDKKHWRAKLGPADAPGAALAARVDVRGAHPAAFQESAPAFPRAAFALCLAGRPSGPDFYVAARGAAPPADPADADPCFATVVGHRGPRLVLLFFKFALPRSESRAARLGADGRDLVDRLAAQFRDGGTANVAKVEVLPN